MKVLTLGIATLMMVPAGALKADVIAYMVTGSDHFGTVDLTTGVYTDTGNMGHLLAGLGAFGSGLYGALDTANTIYQVNPATGALSAITTSGATPSGGWWLFGSTTTSLYGIDANGVLYSINPSTGVVTSIGSTGLAIIGNIGLSSGSSTLYLTENSNYPTLNSSIYTINTGTGSATLFGNTGVGAIGALLFSGGTLYAGQTLPSDFVDTVNTTSGVATAGPALTGTTSNFWGLAQLPASSTPEPASLGLVLFGAAAIFALQRRFAR